MHIKFFIRWLFILLLSQPVFAAPSDTELDVWVNEAIVATYSYNYQNFMTRQKEIARYFTAKAWTDYSAALLNSKLIETVEKNDYFVSSVALMPPEIKELANGWEATMPLLVLYKNPQYQQKQTLNIKLHFITAPAKEGVRGLAITSLNATVTEPPCQCVPAKKK